MRRTLPLLLLALLAGCSGDLRATPTPAPTNAAAQATATSDVATAQPTSDGTLPTANAAPTATLGSSPLQGGDLPPEGVAAQIAAPAGGSSLWGCQALSDDPGLQVTIYEPTYQLLQGFTVCVSGLELTSPALVTLTRPDGRELPITVWADRFGVGEANLVFLPGDTLGLHNVNASQIRQQPQDRGVEIAPATEPQLLAFFFDQRPAQRSAPAGTPIQVVLAGFDDGEPAQLHIYRQDRECAELLCYVTTVEPLVTQGGQVRTAIPTAATDVPGMYAVVATQGETATQLSAAHMFTLEPPLAPGMEPFTAATVPLWSASAGGERVNERPLLYQGSQVTVLDIEGGAVRVRTPEGVEGWIQANGSEQLTNAQSGGLAGRFRPEDRAQVTWQNGIPLRSAPQSGAQPIIEKMNAGTEMTLIAVQGDWLQVRLDDGQTGWARWFYDSAVYVAPKL